MAIPYRVDEISIQALEELIEFQVPESETLDFKQSEPDTWRRVDKNKKATRDEKKAEFLKDIIAFANARGGDLVYGIKEGTGAVAGELCGFSCAEEKRDGLQRSLQALCRENISPPLPLHFRFVPLHEDTTALVIRVPDSWNKPHMVTLNNKTDFYIRRNSENPRMDIHTIRSKVLGSVELRERIQQFRRSRLEQLLNGEMGTLISERSFLLLHLVPVSLYQSGELIDVSSLKDVYRLKTFVGSNYTHSSYNLDGQVQYYKEGQDGRYWRSYVQVFRNGTIEAYDSIITEQELVHPQRITQSLLEVSKSCFEFYERENITPPYVIMLSIYGLGGRKINQPFERSFDREHFVDRDRLFFPDLVVDSIEAQTVDILKPLLTQMWQSFGYRDVWPGVLDKISSR